MSFLNMRQKNKTCRTCSSGSNNHPFSARAQQHLVMVLLALVLLVGQEMWWVRPVHGFGLLRPHVPSSMTATRQQRTTTTTTTANTLVLLNAAVQKQTRTLEEEEAPAGIGGAQFFGGNKQKEEFYDETAEQQAAMELLAEQVTSMNRFDDRSAFATDAVAALSRSLQSQINAALYADAPSPNLDYLYTSSGKLNWQTPMAVKSPTPLEELTEALKFYKYVDMAIVSGQQSQQDGSNNQFELQWELSLAWPTFWEPRVLLLGSSTITMDEKKIISQLDKVVDNGGDLLGTLGKQILPRFWDFYHVGMTPSAELLPRINRKEPTLLFGLNYQTYDIPARWMVQPTVVETGTREDSTAAAIPNHSFSCAIKTMGPTRQRYVPTSPVEVQLASDGKTGKLQVQWNIPLSVEFQSNPEWPLPGEDEEAIEGSEPECKYVYQSRRKVATVQYGGEPQDKEISEIRKELYEQVLKDGLQPKLDTNGRPVFFFLQNTVKPCYTNEGLGMCVYEWRPRFTKANEIGIELELKESDLLITSSNGNGQRRLN